MIKAASANIPQRHSSKSIVQNQENQLGNAIAKKSPHPLIN
ncbi:hypothetical protein VDG1235_2347 [Verrucomicrobiia bacterium DG1235]|nr:hypothetical protein VDG1235_2347 [Verrucomicrobiae bacterium DG1235]